MEKGRGRRDVVRRHLEGTPAEGSADQADMLMVASEGTPAETVKSAIRARHSQMCMR